MTFSAASMLGEIERIVSFGIRRPGYDEGLKTEPVSYTHLRAHETDS